MFIQSNHSIKKFVQQCGVGLPLFFFAVSPYSNVKDADEKTGETREIQQPSDQYRQLANSVLNMSMGMDDEATDSDMSLYNLYLTQAQSMSYAQAPQTQRNFLPPQAPVPVSRGDVTYDDLLRSYLAKIEYMIDTKQDYLGAIVELDKVMVVAPGNQLVQDLRLKLHKKLQAELSRVRGGQGETKYAPPMRNDADIREEALQQAEKMLLDEKQKKRLGLLAQITHEDVVDSLKQEVDQPPVNREVPVRPYLNKYEKEQSQVIDVPLSAEVTRDAALEPVLSERGDMIKKNALRDSVGSETNLLQQIDAQKQTEDMARREALSEKAKNYLLRGKKYFRKGNYALALVSFSKVAQYDIDQMYTQEADELITMVRTKLKNNTV